MESYQKVLKTCGLVIAAVLFFMFGNFSISLSEAVAQVQNPLPNPGTGTVAPPLDPNDPFDPNEPPDVVDPNDYAVDPNAVETVNQVGDIVEYDPHAPSRFARVSSPFPPFLQGELGTEAFVANVPLTESLSVSPFNDCQVVQNNAAVGKDLFVPHKSAEEWESFRNKKPRGVTLTPCPPVVVFPETVDLPVGPSGGPSPGGALPPLTPAAVATTCSAGALKSRTTRVNFPTPAQRCQFGSNGNAPPTRWGFGGRQVQSVQIAPVNTLICGVDFNFVNANIWYDDNIFLLFNDNVLASSYRANPLFANKRGLPQWDWSRIVGRRYGAEHNPAQYWRHRSDDFCNRGSNCRLPGQHINNRGPFELRVPRATIQTAMINNGYVPQTIKIVTTGDNEASTDCYHSGIAIDVSVSYVD